MLAEKVGAAKLGYAGTLVMYTSVDETDKNED